MPKQRRYKTDYPGVFYVMGSHVVTGQPERIYYIRYRRDGKMVEEKVGRQKQNKMTEAKASRIRAKKIDGEVLPNSEQREAVRASRVNRWTLSKLWDEYREQRVDYKGEVADKSRFTKHLEPEFGDLSPDEITTADVDRFRLRLLRSKSPQTVKLCLALFKRLVLFGARKGLTSMPAPAKLHIEMPHVDNEKTEDLTDEQLKALLKAMDEDHHVDAVGMMKMALFTGMRRGELFKLKWADIDFNRGFIFLEDPKGGVGKKIPLNAGTRELLEKHERRGSPFVFPGPSGGQRKDIRGPINRIKRRAGLPDDFRPLHGLRHAYASMLASSGKVDLFTLQNLLTHSTPGMTKRYAHLRDEALKNGAAVVDDLLKEAASK
ncbi:tyrosine-type recombinase/integrase [Pseudodesulfovibrio portus]|uniref:Site-specific recombinase XerD n=1 Tax=Pseudodesulfovibrio portus TaxID=231439 RepID=A0ABN6RRN1_9BACT|nr:site-specific integrase [Pseudodesulfovibrio portus]BDQ33596.1 hypothetical protein JCM14722_11380 [Pseudodesulfovibrio portus]